MATPDVRTPIRPARGLKAELVAALDDLFIGEICYATDEDIEYIVKDIGGGDRELLATSALSGDDKLKLDGIAAGANLYVLPPATASVLGGIKVDNTTVTVDPDGTLHAAGGGGGGSVTVVSGSAPIQVATGTTTPAISVLDATTSAVGVVRLADTTALDAGTAGRVVDAAGLAGRLIPPARTITAGTGLTGGGDLSANRTISADIASQVEAEAGAINTKLMTPLRVAQQVATLVPQSRTITAGTGLTGGGDLTANRTLSADLANQAEAEAGVINTKLMTPLRVLQTIGASVVDDLVTTNATRPLSATQGKALQDGKAPTSRLISAGTGLTGGGDLSLNRTISADLADQAEAEAGSNNTKLMTPLRVAQALALRVPSTRTISAGTGLSGGGDLSADRSFALTGQALLLHNLASNGLFVRNGGAIAARTITSGTGITVSNGNGTAGDPVVAITGSTNGQAIAGTDNTSVMTPLRVAEAIAALSPALTVVREVFTASGSFIKNTSLDVIYVIQCIGAGGSGGRSASALQNAGGGGGGGFTWRVLVVAEITNTVSVQVGAGGLAVSALGGADGNPGGSSSFGSYLTSWGGLGGLTTGVGGRGGGAFDPTTLGDVAINQGGFIGGSGGWASVYGGGGGNSGRSVFGGGGGGVSSGGDSAGGTSTFAGSGGQGFSASSGTTGLIPGGGGGGTETGALSGPGARGEVRIYRLRRAA
jgi:hypothetical protein